MAKKTKPTGKKTAVATQLLPPSGGVAVRMYRQGLGDCFLLAIDAKPKRDEPVYVLIDCGVHARQDAGPDRMSQVLQNLVLATGGNIDVAVATHEHADHLSGFVQNESPFLNKQLNIGEHWLAWTEKRGDRQADRLRMKRAKTQAAINRAIDQLKQRSRSVASQLLGMNDFGEFVDVNPGIAAKAQTSGNPSICEIAIELMRQSANAKYWEPGQVASLPGCENARAYVLGPPRDDSMLHRDLPSGDPEKKETYLARFAVSDGFSLAPAWGDADVLKDVSSTERHPFDGSFRNEVNFAAGKLSDTPPGLDDCSEATKTFINKQYLNENDSWRRIDDEWLISAGSLALNLDSDTNNTSLVLAFEIGDVGSGMVLLFVGDAQVGNWLSWRSLEFNIQGKRVPSEDLIRRTVVYKVGHHASHNATIRFHPGLLVSGHETSMPYGLELMDSLKIAMIPVDRAAAHKPRPWHMPYPPLYARLLEKCDGRVLRSDGLATDRRAGTRKPVTPNTAKLNHISGIPNTQWCCASDKFLDGRKSELYYDITLIP